MKKLLNISFLTLLALAFFVVSCSDEDGDVMESQTIVDIASDNDQFSTLVAALQKADLVSALDSPGAFTVFAPTNDAFAALLSDLGVSSVDDLTSEQLTPILLYHVVGGAVRSTDLSTGYVSTSSVGPGGNQVSLYINVDNEVSLNGSVNVTTADLIADNGVVHVIDKVLTPPTIVDAALANSSFTTLVSAVVKADLAGALSGAGPFTVFAPTNAAFADLLVQLNVNSLEDIDVQTLTNVLLYHVVSGNVMSTELANGMVPTLNTAEVEVNIDNGVTLNKNTNVVLADVQTANGVIHVIDRVLLP